MFLKIKTFTQSLFVTAIIAVTQVNAQESANKNKLPEIGTSGFSILSIDKERIIGDAMMRNIRATQPLINDPVLTEYINDLGNRLVMNAQGVNYSFEFFLINNNEINAFAFFGGHVGVHSGLITLADTESELASVLTHEISHVTQRHLARSIEARSKAQPMTMAAMMSSVLLTLVNPSVGMAAMMTTMAASQQSGINYTRTNEKEADRVGIDLLEASGFDPYGAPAFFNKMAETYRYQTKPPAMLLTHPLAESRISDARTRAMNYSPRPLAPSLHFELAKSRITARYQNDAKANIAYFENALSKERYTLKTAAQYGLALAYFENKENEKAQNLLEKLYQKDQQNLYYIDALSDVYIKTQNFDTALKMLHAVELLMPNNQVVALNYANVLQENKQYDEAAQILQDFLLVKPGNFIAYDLLTTIYEKQDKKALMHVNKAEVLALYGAYQKAIDELQTAYNYAKNQPIVQKRIKGRILQFKDKEEQLKRL